MKKIRTMTLVEAPMERCFKLAISIDLQMAATHEEAVAGVTRGLIGPGQTVTWRGSGFIGTQTYQNLIEVWRPYSYFRDIMISGPFNAYEHEHHFAPMNDGTRIRDEVRFTASTGLLGPLTELLLQRRVAAYLEKRNALIKQVAESDEWHRYLDGQPMLDMRVYQAASATPEKNKNLLASYTG
jgi:ligand-binding SRPBCC domain-containing protein